MSVNDRPPSPNEAAGERPSLFERLRSLLGLGPASIRDDIEDALEDTTTTADFSPQERAMLKNVLGLHELRIADIMLPRADIVAVSGNASLAEVLSLFRTAGHSRLPVYGETLDDPRGMVHIRDFLDHLAGAAELVPRRRTKPRGKAGAPPSASTFGAVDLSTPLIGADILRPVLFVPPSMPAIDLLVKMQATRTHMALVIDEYGGTDGLVSIEDIVEMIVGDIEDEHDATELPTITPAGHGSFVADARASLDDISKALQIDLSASDDAEEVDTIGGLVTTLAGRVPVRGEIVGGEGGLEFEILDADPRRVKRIRVHHVGTAKPRRSGARNRKPDNAVEEGEPPENPAADEPPAEGQH
jgi:CBS domain containing-hemolysin-like protein